MFMAYPKPGLEIKGAPVSSVWIIMGKRKATQMAIPNIKELVDNITLIQVHAFMDEYNFDIKRAKKCCITEILPNGQMMPLCVYNILYRKHLTPTFEDYK